jgi:hypothetical protein
VAALDAAFVAPVVRVDAIGAVDWLSGEFGPDRCAELPWQATNEASSGATADAVTTSARECRTPTGGERRRDEAPATARNRDPDDFAPTEYLQLWPIDTPRMMTRPANGNVPANR